MNNLNKKIKLLDLNFKKNLWADFFWLYKSKFHWVWMEFAELKEYNFWDSIKNIDWKSSARKWKIFSKKMEEERDLKILFVLDNSETMDFWTKIFSKKDVLEQVFYAISFSANSSWDSIWWFIFDENWEKFFPVKKWKENIVKIISEINKNLNSEKNNKNFLEINSKNKNKIENIFQKIHKLNLKNNLIFVLTDEINTTDEKILRIISKENEVIFINIFDDFELNLFWNINDDQNFWSNFFENFSWNFSDWKNFSRLNFLQNFLEKIFWIKNNYQKNISDKINFLNSFYKKNWCEYLKLNICWDYFKELVGFFKGE